MTQPIPVDYRPMWKELGLNLEKHNALLKALGQAYSDLFLSQKNRPDGMAYFDFVMSEIHGLRIKELMDAKAAGRIVVGSYCIFVPEELILAVNGVSIGLCAGAEFGTEAAERYLPRNTCALIKSAFGFLAEKICPYASAADIVVGENTCDGKKKSYEQMPELVSNFYQMDLPQHKDERGRALLKSEYLRFATELEKLSGKKITAEALHEAIKIVNAKRKAMTRLAKARAADPAPISGLDALLANQVFFYDDPVRFTDSVNKIADELETRIAENQGAVEKGATRLVISGCPMAAPNWKMHSLIEGLGAVIVGEESCVGERGNRILTEEAEGNVDETINAIVDRYFKINCAVFTPNPGRVEDVMELVKRSGAQGVVHYSLQFCTPYQVEAGPVEKTLKDAGIPVLRIDTDYSPSDTEQLSTRVGAFLEMIQN